MVISTVQDRVLYEGDQHCTRDNESEKDYLQSCRWYVTQIADSVSELIAVHLRPLETVSGTE